ncbi:hypothetical protein BU17DRAFT_69458 [Hysterangium stoloniferum]|nr:hypothetical protein BU17DRAFT_69458 [Hysterangium stoloniferum]
MADIPYPPLCKLHLTSLKLEGTPPLPKYPPPMVLTYHVCANYTTLTCTPRNPRLVLIGTLSHATHAHMPIIDIVWDDVFLSRAFMILNVSVDGMYIHPPAETVTLIAQKGVTLLSTWREKQQSARQRTLCRCCCHPESTSASASASASTLSTGRVERCVLLDEAEAFGAADDPRLAEPRRLND